MSTVPPPPGRPVGGLIGFLIALICVVAVLYVIHTMIALPGPLLWLVDAIALIVLLVMLLRAAGVAIWAQPPSPGGMG